MRPEIFQAAYAGFSDATGNPLAAGKVYTYDAGTTTPRTTWSNPGKTATNANPVVLDSSGRAEIWCDGNYKFDVRNASDVSVDVVDNVFLGRDDGVSTTAGTSSGAANTYAITVSPALTEYQVGQVIRFTAHQTNTASATANINSLGSRTIQLQGLSQIFSGAIQLNGVYNLMVTSSALILLNPHLGTQSSAPTPTANGGGSLSSIVTNRSQFFVNGSQVKYSFSFTFTVTGTCNSVRIPLPISAISSAELAIGCYVDIGGGNVGGFTLGVGGGGSIDVFHYAGTVFAAGASRACVGQVTYSWI